MSDRIFTIQTRVNRPVAEVFQAVVQEDHLCRYFTDRASGPLREGEQVIWTWSTWGDYPVVVKRIVANERIELEIDSTAWKKTTGTGYPVQVVLEFQALDEGSTMVSISESGWHRDEAGLKASHENCGGWQHMALCLKAYLEHGIDLR
jgi:uncharacterized protein YndB with AHSA1/START domain